MARLAASRQPSDRQHPPTAARSRASSSVAARALVRWVSPWAPPWVPSPCPCHVVREAIFTEAQYGGYRPMAFLMRTFFDAFRNRSALPSAML